MKQLIYIISVLTSLLFFAGCKKTDNQKTTLEIVDNDRHYYPVLQGDQKKIIFPILNKGENAFVLSDLIVSCGCIAVKKASIQHIPSGGEGKLILEFDTTKNIGYVKHYISIYGNLENRENIEVVFDLNVVPDAHYTKDYEQLYMETKRDKLQNLVDGTIDRDYYLEIE